MITDSDHCIIHTEWLLNPFYHISRTKHHSKRKIYHYTSMNQESQNNFTIHIEQNISLLDINDNLLILNINQIWHKIATLITNSDNKYIPNSISTNRKYYTYSLLATKLYTGLQLIGSIICSLTAANNYNLNDINAKLNKVNTLTDLEIQILIPTDIIHTNLKHTTLTLKQYYNTLYKARN